MRFGGCVSRFRLEPNSTSSSSSSREKKKSSKNERLPTVNWVGWKWKGDCVYGRLLAQSAPRDNPIPTPRILFMIIHLFSPSSLCAPAIPHLWRRGSGPTSLLNPTLYSTIFFPFSLFFSWVYTSAIFYFFLLSSGRRCQLPATPAHISQSLLVRRNKHKRNKCWLPSYRGIT